MKKTYLLVICFTIVMTILFSGCLFDQAVVESTPSLKPFTRPMKVTCPLPDGYQLLPAIETARTTMMSCPEKFDLVFEALLGVAKHSPAPENSMLIQDFLKDMVRVNKVSKTYAKRLYRRYFSHKFVSIPSVKIYNLSGKLQEIKIDLKEELASKQIGMTVCSNDKEGYKRAEKEYFRARTFLENLAYNEEFIKESN